MRSVNRVINITIPQEVPVTITSEELAIISENKPYNRVEVTIHSMDGNGDVIKMEALEIASDMYALLMSESPSFAPGKPENEYREEDLWYVIDLIRVTT